MGNVYVQKRGNVFQYQFQVASVDGKRKYKNKSGFSTRNETFKEGVKAYTEYMNTGHAFTPNEISYSDYLDYWMKEHCEINLKYHTIEAYKSIIRIHVKPKLGHYMLSTITTATLQEFINKVYLDGSYSSVVSTKTKKGKTYYFKVRSYTTFKENRVYSPYSSFKSIKRK